MQLHTESELHISLVWSSTDQSHSFLFSRHCICLIMSECQYLMHARTLLTWKSLHDVRSCNFVFVLIKISICWMQIYRSLPLTSVAAVPFANWIVAETVLLSISWSMKFWSAWPALQVEGVWPHSNVTSVSSSLAERGRRKRRRKTGETGDKNICFHTDWSEINVLL